MKNSNIYIPPVFARYTILAIVWVIVGIYISFSLFILSKSGKSEDFLLVFGIFGIMIVLLLSFSFSWILNPEDLEIKARYFFAHLIISVLFIILIVNLSFKFGWVSEDLRFILSVGVAGAIGGVLNYLWSLNKSDNSIIYFSEYFLYLISSAVVSVVGFLILRSGVIQRGGLDSFNLFGVTGVASIAGFYAEDLMGRAKKLLSKGLFSSEKKSD